VSKLISYTFTVLRYVHDITAGEFLNVGVVVYAPEARFLMARTRTTYGRLTKVFPDANGDAFKRIIGHVESAIETAAARLDDLFPESGASALDFAFRVLPQDDNSLQWSPLGSGRTSNPEKELDVLFERMVTRHETKGTYERRNEDEVWKSFSRSLQKRNLLSRLQAKEIVASADSKTFGHAWKNGIWHCLEPISFDLVDPERIHNKALRWLGQMAALQGATEPFKLYMLIGEPQHEHVQASYLKARRILESMPGNKEIFTEAQADDLSLLVEHDVLHHAVSGPEAALSYLPVAGYLPKPDK
jgi:hypothetical protein